jgi:hypothetical protein
MNRSRVPDIAECPPEAVISRGQGFAYALHVNSYNYGEGCR